jgi:EmrB/QacA subfamily drug resistance transporter
MIPNRILLPLIVACALFMENLDATVLATALPTIAAEFGESPIHLKLALTSYLLSLAVFIPASSWIADRFGVRLVFRAALVVFTVSSILCGLSNTVGELVIWRSLQGLGGAMMVPVGRMVILRSVKKSELVGALAWLTIPALVGPVVGPVLGGFITTYFDWRWIFWINIPIGILGVVLATIYFPDIRAEKREKFDVVGFLLVAPGLATFVTGSTTLGLGVLPAPVVIGLLAIGTALLGAYVWHSRRVARPILDLALLKLRTFRASITGGFLFRVGVGATPFLLPLMLQLTFGMTPFESGLVTFVTAIGAIAMKFLAVPILRRFGFRRVLIGTALIAACFTALPAAFTPEWPLVAMLALLLVGGFFRSLQFTSLNSIAYDEVAPDRISNATSMSAVGQQLSTSIGISIGAIALSIASGGGDDIVRGDFILPFCVIGFIVALSAILYWFLPPTAGSEMSGHSTTRGSADGEETRVGTGATNAP